METIKVGINGFGRIARVILRSLATRDTNIDVRVINVRTNDHARMAYLLEYDSVFGRFKGEIHATEEGLSINGKEIPVLGETDPAEIEWDRYGAEYIIESTGAFTTMKACRKHFLGGAKKVILTAPGKSENFPTFVMGVNNEDYNPATTNVVSNASCTTNCLAPLTKVVLKNFGIKRALMSTIHASTSKQKPVDSSGGRDWRTGRSVFNNIIPSSTGAAKAVGQVMPEMEGKMTGMSFRIPASDVSVVDLTAELERETTYEEICEAIREASETYMKGIIEYNIDELVSSDLRGNYHTCIFDKKAGIMLDGMFVKLIAWYDNEWGYSNKVIDLVMYMAKRDAEYEAALAEGAKN